MRTEPAQVADSPLIPPCRSQCMCARSTHANCGSRPRLVVSATDALFEESASSRLHGCGPASCGEALEIGSPAVAAMGVAEGGWFLFRCPESSRQLDR